MKTIATVLSATLLLGVPACATGPVLHPPTGLRIGAVSEPSSFEKRHAASTNDTFEAPEKSDASRRRKLAFWAGVGLAAGGAAGALGFGIGGRVTQAQVAKGYEDESLTRADEARLERQGNVMNALTLTTVGIGLFGLALLSVAYALDHARCGELPPKRDDCVPKRKSSAAPDPAPPPAEQ